MKLNFYFLILSAFVFSGVEALSQIHQEYTVDENGRVQFLRVPSQAPQTTATQSLNPAELNLDWSSPDENVSNHQAVDSWDTRLAVGADNSVNIVYNDNHPNGLQKIMYRQKSQGEWSEPIFVDTGGEIGGRNNHAPVIAASPNGDLHVIYTVWAFSNFRNYMGYSYYNAATQSWSEGIKISDVEGTIDMFDVNALYSTEDNLPVAIWGYDNRENTNVDEIYMTYFDGESWSSDIAVSELSDGFTAYRPRVSSLGNQTSIILYSEFINSSQSELRYRIYDETTHALSEGKAVDLGGIHPTSYLPLLYNDGNMNMLIGYVQNNHLVFRIAVYNPGTDSFALKDDVFEFPNNSFRSTAWDCNQEGDCGIIFTDYSAEQINYMAYSPDTGFSEPLTLVNEDPSLDTPFAGFDSLGNLHITWSDLRFYPGSGFLVREIFYKEGKNLSMGVGDVFEEKVVIYPNPAKDFIMIQTDEKFRVEIFDSSGKLIQTKSISGTTRLNHSLSSGVYFIRLNNEKGSLIKKIIVK